jgi:hypothetical protein
MRGITSSSSSSSSLSRDTKASPHKIEESKESNLESLLDESRPNSHTPIGSLGVKAREKKQKA